MICLRYIKYIYEGHLFKYKTRRSHCFISTLAYIKYKRRMVRRYGGSTPKMNTANTSEATTIATDGTA